MLNLRYSDKETDRKKLQSSLKSCKRSPPQILIKNCVKDIEILVFYIISSFVEVMEKSYDIHLKENLKFKY